MTSRSETFKFNGAGIAKGYDDYLVPVMFDPWADRLLDRLPPPEEATVLDLASGTGIVAQKLAQRVGPSGTVYAVDPNDQMLAVAQSRCAGESATIKFIVAPADAIDLPDESVDILYCQQGWQFFPDREAAAREIFRLLRPGGKVILTTWLPFEECPYFGAIAEALNECDEPEIAQMLAIPFNFMPTDELKPPFETQAFAKIIVEQDEADLQIPGGIERAYETVFGIPIAPKLQSLPPEKQTAFRNATIKRLEALVGTDGITYGNLVTNVLMAEKE